MNLYHKMLLLKTSWIRLNNVSFFVTTIILFTAKSTTSFALGVLVLVVMMEMFVVDVLLDLLDFFVLLNDGRLVDFFVDSFLLLYDCWLVMMVNAFRMRMRMLVVLLFDGNMNDDLLFLDVTKMFIIEINIVGNL